MKYVCDRLALHEALSATGSVTTSRTSKPILQCVRLTAEKDALVVTAYDQEVGIRYRVREVEVSKAGEALVMGERLMGIIRESGDETMAFEMADDLLHVRGADSHFQIVSQDVREFPPVPDMEGDADFRVKVGSLRTAVDRTLFAAARESTRYAINGVLWEKRGKQLKMVATDGRRLALCGASLESSVGDDQDAIVPTKALALLGRLHFEADEMFEVKLSSNQVILRSQRATISSVLAEGHFPKYEDVIPRELDKKLELKTAEFQSAVKRAALLASQESRGIRLHISSEGMVLSSRAPEQGEATVRLDLDYAGEKLEIGFNPEFLLEGLKVCGETLSLELKAASKPGLIRSAADFQYVVMPVNLS